MRKWCDECSNASTDKCSKCITKFDPDTNDHAKPSKFVSKESDMVNHPSHYQGKNECIDVMIGMFGVQAVIDFCRCNAYKYRFRSQMKNGEEDIKKAEWYETKMIELLKIKERRGK